MPPLAGQTRAMSMPDAILLISLHFYDTRQPRASQLYCPKRLIIFFYRYFRKLHSPFKFDNIHLYMLLSIRRERFRAPNIIIDISYDFAASCFIIRDIAAIDGELLPRRHRALIRLPPIIIYFVYFWSCRNF